MCLSNDGKALEIFKWGNRALYLMLFISGMVVMGYWHVTITWTFLGSVCALILPLLFYKEDEEREKPMSTKNERIRVLKEDILEAEKLEQPDRLGQLYALLHKTEEEIDPSSSD